MNRWADYVITGVRWSEQGRHITQVLIRPDAGQTLGPVSAESRLAIAAAIHAGLTFVTAFWNETTKSWQRGSAVRTVRIDGIAYLRTDANHVREDNLDELPGF